MPRWAFIRHGQSVANAEGWLAGQIDAPLTEAGRAQARSLRGRLEGYERVLSSDLRRAADTARLAGFGLPLSLHPELRERTVGHWDGKRRVDLGPAFQVVLSWGGRPPQGESQEELARRVLAFLGRVEDDRDTIVVCHGGVIRVVLGLVEGLPRDEIAYRKVPNALPIEVTLPTGHFRELLPTPPGGVALLE